MRRPFMFLVCGFLLMMLLLPYQATAAESGSTVAAESSKSDVTMVAGGGSHSLALKQDGTVWAWGNNDYGQISGDYGRDTPGQVQGLDSVEAIAAGSTHSMALKSDGTVWTWGWNAYGQLGDGSPPANGTVSSSPVKVTGLSSVAAIAAGSNHNLVVKSDGTVWAWGGNWYGQLGDGSTTMHNTPVQVQRLSSVIDVAAGGNHSLALKSDGTVWAWGKNDYGQLGDGSTTNSYTPVQIQGLDSVIDVAASNSLSMALKSDGTLWAWGYNGYYGQLGDGSTTDRYTPVQVQGLGSVEAIAAGPTHNMALKSDGTVWAWGDNSNGQLGDGSTHHSKFPVQVTELDSVSAIAIGGRLSLAVKSDGTLWAWGSGYGTSSAFPVQVASSGAPQWPVDDVLTVTDVTYNSVQLNWQPATDETRIDKYLLYQDNTRLDTLNGDVNSYEVRGLSPNTSYLFSLIAVDADGNQSKKKDMTFTTPAAPGAFHLSDSESYEYGGSHYEYLLYDGLIWSPRQEIIGSWTPPAGFHGTVTVSMIHSEDINCDLSLATVGEGNQSPVETKKYLDGSEFSKAEVPEGYAAEWMVEGSSLPNHPEKVHLYVTIRYDDH